MAALWGLIVLLLAGPAPDAVLAKDQIDLARALRLDEVIQVLREEGLAWGADLDATMLSGRGGAFWASQVARVYDQGRMEDYVRTALLNGMTVDEIDRSLAFFDTPRGQRILSLETSARRAMTDSDVEQMAYDGWARVKDSDDARLALLTRLAEVNDLVERNVTGSLNARYSFLRGLVDGHGSEMSEAQITRDVWQQEDEVRTETFQWLFGFMVLAYDPLSDADLEAYITYSATPAGQSLNNALFDGFDAMYRAISRDLGRIVARSSTSSEL